MRRAIEVARLALADLRHDRLATICQVVLVMAVVSPMLLLFALKEGVATTLIAELENNPETLRLRPVGSYRLEDSFFARLSERPETGFLVPATRAIAAQIWLSASSGLGAPLVDAQMLPSAPGDPLAEGGAPLAGTDGEASITEKIARELGVKPGDALIGRIERSRNGRPEVAEIALKLRTIVPERLHQGATVFVDLPLLVAAERYRDGFAVPALSAAGDRPWEEMREFASFRLYAGGLEEVAPLAEHLRRAGIEVRTEADQIAGVLALDRNLSVLLAMLGAIAGMGMLGALLAGMISGLERKRRVIATLGLLGCEQGSLVLFPVTQAVAIAAVGAVASLALYAAAAMLVNAWFSPSMRAGEVAARLGGVELSLALAAAMAAPLLPALLVGRKAARIEPSEALREI